MILATDVHYKNSTAEVAGVLFDSWSAKSPEQELTCTVENIQPYESGSFYKRELPCIIALLHKHSFDVDCIVVDGYVYLDDDFKPGLGKHLYDALHQTVLVIGVAKTPFQGMDEKYEVYRGESNKPLYVTATEDLNSAKNHIASMHGEFRLPSLLKRVDQLCRGHLYQAQQ